MDLVLNTYTTSIATLSLIFCVYIFLFRPSKAGHGREAPLVAGAWPIIGHLPLLRGSQKPHRTLGAMADKYGPIFTIKLGATPTLVLSNWEMAKECFTTNDMVVSSRPKLVATEHLAYNGAMFSFAPYGPYWRQVRKIVITEFLSNRRIELLSHTRVSELQTSIKELYSVWLNKKNDSGYVLVELKQWFSQLTFNMILRMIAGKRYFGTMDVANEKEAERFLKGLNKFLCLLGVFTVGDAVPSLRWLDLGGHEKAMKETAKELDNVVSEWLEEHRQKRASSESNDQDFIDVMLSVLEAKKIDGFEFDADTIHKSTTLLSHSSN
ncbi:Cytochrome P450 [Sesbania bispinosa]|nr:Cytochrome P450 [Sesbania bispinosa]